MAEHARKRLKTDAQGSKPPACKGGAPPLESPEALSKEDRAKRLRECMPHHRKPVGASAKEREWIGPKVILKRREASATHNTRAAQAQAAAAAAMATN